IAGSVAGINLSSKQPSPVCTVPGGAPQHYQFVLTYATDMRTWHIHVRNDVLLQHEGKHEFHCKMEVQVSKDEDIVPIVDSLRRLYGANARVRVFRSQTMTVASGDFGGLGDVVFNLRDPKN